MKSKPDDENDEDRALFRQALQGVKPLPSAKRVTPVPGKPRARARFTRAQRFQVFEETAVEPATAPDLEAADASSFARPGIPASVVRKLRRGQFRVEAELDLHGHNAAQAGAQLRDFLSSALQQNLRCVRIVHGKGLRSGARGPVLRQLVDGSLRRTRQVLAFTSARPVDGGTGAVYVLLAASP